jgi:glycosyltransferase involved in cell wall biosynthesis
MKVVRIIARLNVGGPARHVAWLTAELPRVGYDSVLVAGTVPPGEDDMAYFARAQGVRPVIIPEMSREISLKDAVTVWKLYRLFVRERPDVVHTHTAKAGTVGRVAGLLYRWLTPSILIARPRRCRIVHTYHGHVFHSYYGRLKTRLFLMIEKILARVATDLIVCLSAQQFREIHHEFSVGRAEQFAVVPLGLDTDVFADWAARREAARKELGINVDDCLVVGIVGRLTEIKNHQLFLDAAALYDKEQCERGSLAHKCVRFVVVGGGHLRASLEAHARALGLDEKVIFTGSRPDPENFYAALDIVALTSLNEGTPLTLIEAMANARPVIATTIGGVVDLIGESLQLSGANDERSDDGYQICERGVGVRPGDVNGFVRGLVRLTNDADLRREMGERGRMFVGSKYSKKRLVADIKNLYDDLLLPKSSAVDARHQLTLERRASEQAVRAASLKGD